MFQFLSFGSGSCGNCYYISNGNTSVLIDAGVGIRRMKRHFKEYGLKFSSLKAILVTHDHTDHIKAVGHLSNEFNIPVYTTEKIHDGIRRNYHTTKKIEPSCVKIIEVGQDFSIDDLRISTFEIPHDASENIGYSIDLGQDTFTLMTDIGCPTDDIKKFISQSGYLVIEANYDAEMLKNGKYPKPLQDRIRGGFGHLCNTQTAETLGECFHENLKRVWLCHLSEENNHPELARKTVEYHLRGLGIIPGKDFDLEVLKRKIPSGLFTKED